MRNLALIIMICGIQISLFAQQDPKAKEVLDRLAKKTKAYETVEADFTHIYESQQQKIGDTTSGTIFIKGSKYKLLFSGYERFYDGDKIITYIIDANEANITKPSKGEEEELNPANIFNIYQQNFKYILKEEEKIKGKKLNVIDLFPMEPDKKKYSRIRLKIAKLNDQIYSIQQFNKDGNKFTILVNDLKPNVKLPDKIFSFDKSAHPKVEIVDMRD